MKRVANWISLLPAHTGHSRKRGFAWGTRDCALAACDAIKALTGIDPAENFRGKYSTPEEAAQLIGSDLGAFAARIAAQYGMQEVPPQFARRGDVVFVDNGRPEGGLGIVDLTGARAACASQNGSLLVPMRRWKRAWRVG